MEPSLHVKEYILCKPKGYVDKTKNIALTNKDLLRLNLSENGEGVPTSILEKINWESLGKVFSEYPDATYDKLISALCGYYKVHKENVGVGAGANELIERISKTYLSKNDRVVVYNPTFYRFADAALRNGSHVINIDLKEENNYELTVKEAEQASHHQPKIIWICNPNNPTGKLVERELICKIAQQNPQALICIDEACAEYVQDWQQDYSSINLLEKYPNIVILKTFSKFYALAGLVVGYVLASPSIIENLNHMRLEFPVNGLALEIASKIITSREAYYSYHYQINQEIQRINTIFSRLDSLLFIPTKTNIIMVKHKTKDLYMELLKKNILVTDLTQTEGIIGKKYVRITINLDQTKNDFLVRAIQDTI